MRTVILDTNFLFIPFTHKVDIFTEINRIVQQHPEISVLEESLAELEKLIEFEKGKEKDRAKMALQLIKRKDLKIIKQKDLKRIGISKTHVDSIILHYADPSMIVATQDKALRDALRDKGIPIIYLRKKKLEIQDVL
jgi:rRNA-processing protein FCF1